MSTHSVCCADSELNRIWAKSLWVGLGRKDKENAGFKNLGDHLD